jgi:hypothetical protein
MSYHFRVGEFVRLDLTPSRSAEKVFEVVRLLPVSEDGECQYQVRSEQEKFTRVARESQLARASASEAASVA